MPDNPKLQLRISPHKEAYTAELVTDLLVTDLSIRDRYQIRLQTGEAKINRLLVWFDAPRLEEVRWELADRPQLLISTRRLKVSEQADAGFSEQGEAWELKWSELIQGEVGVQRKSLVRGYAGSPSSADGVVVTV